MKTKTRLGGWTLFSLLAATVTTLAIAILALHPVRVEAVRLVIRVTAYTSFVPFVAAFVASSAVALAPSRLTRWLLRERRTLGLSFAFSHLVHLVAIVAYGAMNPQFWPSRGIAMNVPGAIAYLFIALMTATSFHAVSRHLGAGAWKRLHTTGMWVVATLFALAFLSRTASTSGVYAVPLVVLAAAVAVRVAGKRAQARKRARRSDRLVDLDQVADSV